MESFYLHVFASSIWLLHFFGILTAGPGHYYCCVISSSSCLSTCFQPQHEFHWKVLYLRVFVLGLALEITSIKEILCILNGCVSGACGGRHSVVFVALFVLSLTFEISFHRRNAMHSERMRVRCPQETLFVLLFVLGFIGKLELRNHIHKRTIMYSEQTCLQNDVILYLYLCLHN